MADTPDKVIQLKATMKTLSSAENAKSKMFPPHFADPLQLSIETYYKQELGQSGSKVTFLFE